MGSDLVKREGWEQLLAIHIEQAKPAVFQWGQTDCALWCADWVKQAADKDFTTDWRGKYSTEEELQALMKTRSYHSPADIADAHLPRIPVQFAQRGDIVLHPQGCLGICDGLMSRFLTLNGLTRLPTFDCLLAWKVE